MKNPKRVAAGKKNGKSNRAKGARGERAARDWLRSLGFDVSERQSQYRSGVKDGNELVVGGVLCCEIKYQNGFNIGTDRLTEACKQAETDAKGKPWCVVWRATGRRQWNLTYHDGYGNRHTLDTDTAATWWITGILAEVER